MKTVKFSGMQSVTAVDNNFIDNYMTSAPSPLFSIVYIYCLRCASGGLSVTPKDIAKKLKILESDVINAWNYWEKQGLIKFTDSDDGIRIEFRYSAFAGIEADEPEEAEEGRKTRVIEGVASVDPENVEKIIKETPELAELLDAAEAIKGKPVSQKETEVIVWMHQSLELPYEVIFILLSYCLGSDKNARYMEKTALDWADKGICTEEDATSYLSFSTNYGKVLEFFGVTSRSATKKEVQYVDKWIKEWEMSLDLIELAAGRTVEKTGKVSFAYCDKILENWHSLSLTTVEDVRKNEEEYTNIKAKSSKKKSKLEPPKGVFNNYTQREYTDEEIDEILRRKGSIF